MPRTSLAFATREHGDFRVDGPPDELTARRRALAPGDWTWLHQVHGGRVVTVGRPGGGAGSEADAAVTDVPGAVLAIHTADCLPVLLEGDGVVGAAHVGWRGLCAGVIEATLDVMTELGATHVTAHLGPHIRANCYEFGERELAAVADRYGEVVRATTGWGTPALDLLAGARAALSARPGAAVATVEPGCTACEPDRFFSHRARSDAGRHAAVISIDP